MKTFDDLIFIEDPRVADHYRAHIQFNNDYILSVVTGFYAFTNDEAPYECAVFKPEEDGFRTHEFFDDDIGDDVKGYMTKEEVAELMIKIQSV